MSTLAILLYKSSGSSTSWTGDGVLPLVSPLLSMIATSTHSFQSLARNFHTSGAWCHMQGYAQESGMLFLFTDPKSWPKKPRTISNPLPKIGSSLFRRSCISFTPAVVLRRKTSPVRCEAYVPYYTYTVITCAR